jgi:lipoprotein NlpI
VKATELDPKSALYYQYRAYLEFDLHRWNESLADLRKMIELDAVDQDYAQIRIWLIRARTERPVASTALTAYMSGRKDSKPSEWTGSSASSLAGAITEAELTKRAGLVADAKIANGQLCEAYFYAASIHELAGDIPGAIGLFRKTLATNATICFEYLVPGTTPSK